MQPETLLLDNGEPDETDIEVPSKVSPPNGLVITQKDVNDAKRALKKSGLTTIDLTKTQAKSELGKFFIGLGLFKLSATKWIVTSEDLETVFDKSVALDAQVKDPEARVEILKIQDSLLKQRAELIRIGFKAGAADIQAQSHNQPGNIPFPPNTPVQILISTNSEQVEVK